MDCLTNPGADMGMDLPSMLEWKYFPEKKVQISFFHIIIRSFLSQRSNYATNPYLSSSLDYLKKTTYCKYLQQIKKFISLSNFYTKIPSLSAAVKLYQY